MLASLEMVLLWVAPILAVFVAFLAVAKTKQKPMLRIPGDFHDVLINFLMEFSSDTDEFFFLVRSELAALNAIQAEMASTKNRNWAIMQEQFVAFDQNFHFLRDCNQLLLSNQQLNFNFDSLSSLLAMIHTTIKSYRSALFPYRVNLLNAFLFFYEVIYPCHSFLWIHFLSSWKV